MRKFFWLPVIALIIVMMSTTALAQDDLSGTPDAICESALPVEDPESRDYAAQPELTLETGVDYHAIFCTGAGAIYIDLFENYTPITVNNFVALANDGYYNNTNFHRVLESFMAQGGDPTNSGMGGPGYQFADEFPRFLTFDRPGLLAMANSGPGTNGSQFFITTSLPDWLNYNHTIFGEVVDGYDNVLNIELRDPQGAVDGDGTELSTVIIITDPSAVEVDAEMAMTEPADAETIVDALAPLTAELPEELAVDEATSGVFDTETVVAAVPEDIQEDYATFLADNGHQYRAGSGVNNVGCSDEVFFTTLSYSVDAFDSAESAAAVYDDPFLATLNEAEGFSGEGRSEETWIPVFHAGYHRLCRT